MDANEHGEIPVEPAFDFLRTLSREETNLKNIRKAIRAIERYAENEAVSNIYKIQQEMLKIEKILKQTQLTDFVEEDVGQRIQPVKSEMPEWEEQAKKSFGKRLEDALKQADFELSGHYPLLKVMFYTLEVKLETNSVVIWYGPEQERLDACKLIPETAAKKLGASHKKIVNRDLNDEVFLLNLFEAYKTAAHHTNKKIGDSIPVSDILLEYALLVQSRKFRTNPVKSSYKEYGRVFFSYDLYRLTERTIENHELSLVTATRAYTRRRAGFLWVPSNEKGDGTYISHIRFREV
ncbi:MAG: hypothetical protein EF813_08910 [Methanosarcinales archaeon]|nr:MAG: hypothetical protein EF813_08910 [Methanosarcinales archaeon]